MLCRKYNLSLLSLMRGVLIGLSLALAMPSLAGAQDTIGCPQNMSHYWKLDETSGTTYDDLYGTDASCSNCPLAVSGRVSGAQDFDGVDDQVSVSDDGTFDWGPTASFSIELWMKKDDPCSGTSSTNNNIIVGRYDGTGPNPLNIWWLGVTCDLVDGQGRIRFVLRDDGGPTAAGTYVVSDNSVIGDGWHHVVAIRDGDAGVNRLYVDGARQQDSLVYTYGQGFAGSTNLTMGYIDFGGHFRCDGIIDEVALYDRVLSDSEIIQHHDRGLDGQGYCHGTPQFMRGDCNCDMLIDIGDLVFLLNFLFKDGTPPDPLWTGDANCDGYVTLGDVVYLINYLYKSGPAPTCVQ